MSINEYTKAINSGKDIPSMLAPFLSEIEKRNGNLNAFTEIFSDISDQVRDAEKKKNTPLVGVPFGVKDNILIKGKFATAGSKILSGFKAPYDATVISRLRDAGAIFIGRTNMDEFAMGSSTENSFYGPTKNPHDETRVPGGSSGGSAAAVSAGFTLAALGSDTGGSIRQPAAFCGAVGLKSTYGSVSRYGLIAMASSLDQIGPFAQSVGDAEIIFKVISGYDPKDATSAVKQKSDTSPGVKIIGYPEKLLSSGIDDDVRDNFFHTIEALKDMGYKTVPLEIQELSYALSVYYVLMPAEASSNLARFDGVRYGFSKKGRDTAENLSLTRGEGFGKEVRRRIVLGTYVLSAGYYDAYYKKAQDIRAVLSRSFSNTFTSCDAYLMPTSPTPAFRLGEKTSDPLSMYLSDVFTVSANLAGVPALSVPSGHATRDGKKLPVGVQILAPHFCEERVFSVGKEVEKIAKKNA